MSFDFKHNLDGVIDPESLQYLFDQLAKTRIKDDLLNAPFIRVEYDDSSSTVFFWRPKDSCVSEDDAVDLGVSYCEHFIKMCGRHKTLELFPLIIAGMIKNGNLGELEISFLKYFAQFAVAGLVAYNISALTYELFGGFGEPDFSWITKPRKS